jgi:DNA-binding beta-propeller fold protein YncE
MKRAWLVVPLFVASIPQCSSTPSPTTDGGGDDGGVEGGCAKDCLGGACNAGMCAPVALATKQGGPIGLAQLGDRVYWTDYGSSDVTSADKLDASLHVLGTSPLIDQPWGIAADDSKIYVANSGGASTVIACQPDQCGLSGVLDDGAVQPTAVSLAGNFLYYMEPYIGEIYRTPKYGGVVQDLATTSFFYGDELFAFVVSDGTYVYWSEPNTDKIRRQAVAAQPVDVFTLSPGSFPSALLIDGTTLYFVAQGSGNADGIIGYGTLDGTGGAQTLASKQQLPWGLAVDANYLYWTTSGTYGANDVPNGDGGVYRCEKVNCTTPVQLAGNLADARGIAVDDGAIYFTTYATGNGDGTIWRLAK